MNSFEDAKRITEMRKKIAKYTDETDVPLLEEFAYKNNVDLDFISNTQEFAECVKKMMAKKEAQLKKLGFLNIINPSVAMYELKEMEKKKKKSQSYDDFWT